MSAGWTLPIRRWLALALIATFFIPAVVTGAVAASQFGAGWHAGNEAAGILRAGAARWTDPAWQRAAKQTLARQGVDFVLAEYGRTIYRSTADPLAGTGANTQRTVQRIAIGGSRHEVATIYSGRIGPAGMNGFWVIPLAGLGTLLLTLAAIAWFLGRTLVRPLAAAAEAARRIAAGDLDIALPPSHVREVAALNAAFIAMSAELRSSLQRQAAVEEERTLFVSAIAHDLRTPLFSLRGYLEGLEQGLAATPLKRAEYIRVCREKADVLERLIADLFAFTRIEYLEQTLRPASLDLDALLRDVVACRGPEAEAGGTTLTVHGPAQPVSVEGDPHLLRRAIENLLDNALRYTPAGGMIAVECSSDGDRATFAVADTGPGIAPRDLPHLFEPMYRGDPSRHLDTGGAGLGLTIARRILRAHGGDLTAANRPGGGAEFTAFLPAGPARRPAAAVMAGQEILLPVDAGVQDVPSSSLPPSNDRNR